MRHSVRKVVPYAIIRAVNVSGSWKKTCCEVFLVLGSTYGSIIGLIFSSTTTGSTSVGGALGQRPVVWGFRTSTILHGT